MAPPLAIDTVLVPVDGSDESTEAVEYAVAIAGRYDASVHAMYVFGGEAARAIESGAVDEPAVAAESRSYFDAVEAIGDERGVPMTCSTAYGFSSRSKLVHPGSVILDAADQMAADFVVVPRQWSDDAADVLEKAAEYVLLYASQPVLSV